MTFTTSLSTPADVVATTTTTTPLINYDQDRPSLAVRNVAPELLAGFNPRPRSDWWSVSPKRYGPVLWTLCQQVGVVDLTVRRRRVSEARAYYQQGRCDGHCTVATTLECSCPHCAGRRHGQLARLVWSPPTIEPVHPTWLLVEHYSVAWPIGRE